MVSIAQREAESKFFRVETSVIEEILNGSKLNVLDIGARAGMEYGLKKYSHLLNITLVEPDPEESPFLKRKGINFVEKLIGGKEGKGVLNICRKRANSSTFEPNGRFLDYYTSGNTERFSVINRVEVPMITVESLIKETGNQFDYIKLDVQGSEYEILMSIGEFLPLIVKSEISFVPLYKNSKTVFHLGKVLYDMGYILFHIAYTGKSAPAKHNTTRPYDETIIPLHGDAWFMPDWTRNEGIRIIKGSENQYKALMQLFGMRGILEYALMHLERVG